MTPDKALTRGIADWLSVDAYLEKHSHLPSDTAAPCRHCFEESQAYPGTRFAEARERIEALRKERTALFEENARVVEERDAAIERAKRAESQRGYMTDRYAGARAAVEELCGAVAKLSCRECRRRMADPLRFGPPAPGCLCTDAVALLAKHTTGPGTSEGGLRCRNCGKRAACVGQYESMTSPEPACDDCCGHGNEDGHCGPIGPTSEGGR